MIRVVARACIDHVSLIGTAAMEAPTMNATAHFMTETDTPHYELIEAARAYL